MTEAMLSDELRNRFVAVRGSSLSDPIPQTIQRNHMEPSVSFVFARVFDMRHWRRLGSAWRARDPRWTPSDLLRNWFSQIRLFFHYFGRFLVNYGRDLFAPDCILHITQRDLMDPSFPFVFPRVFDMRLCKTLGSAWRARGSVRPHWI